MVSVEKMDDAIEAITCLCENDVVSSSLCVDKDIEFYRIYSHAYWDAIIAFDPNTQEIVAFRSHVITLTEAEDILKAEGVIKDVSV